MHSEEKFRDSHPEVRDGHVPTQEELARRRSEEGESIENKNPNAEIDRLLGDQEENLDNQAA